jgi:nitrilase
MSPKVAVIQTPPVLLHRDRTIAKALLLIDEAVKEGASLIVFPEAYVPGYPMWIWRLRPGGDMGISGDIHARLRENAINLACGDLQPVQDAAAKHGVTVVLGINELDSEFSGTTLFNTVVCTENSVRIALVIESPNVSDDGRTVMLRPDTARLAVQVEEPA